METKVCNKCDVEHPISYFYKNVTKSQGVQGECKDCWREYDGTQRMYINGKRINKDHPLWKPGRFKSLDDAWSHTEIDERTTDGEVYIIRNSAWPEWQKIGKAVDAKDRLKGYQTGSPKRDYELIHAEWFSDRHAAEKAIHKMLEQHKSCHERRGEWFKSYDSVIKEVMREYKETQGQAA